MPRTSRRREMQFSLGWELEAETGARNTPPAVLRGSDGSVHGEGLEYKISEEFVNRPNDVLAALKNLTADQRLRVGRSCGFHVHVGLQTQTPMAQTWASWMVTLARILEPVAFEAVPESRRNNHYCARWANDRNSVQARSYSRSKHSNNSRYYWMNVVEMFRAGGIKTCEVRLLGNTRRFSYLLSWTSACMLMAKAAWRLVYDPSLLPVEQGKLEEVFKRIKNDVLPNQNAATCQNAANDLATQAGFTVRADVIPPQTNAQREQARHLESNRATENRIFDLTRELGNLGRTIPEHREGSREVYAQQLETLLNNGLAQELAESRQNAARRDLSDVRPEYTDTPAQPDQTALERILGNRYNIFNTSMGERAALLRTARPDGDVVRDRDTGERLDNAAIRRRMGLTPNQTNENQRRELSCAD